MQKKRLKISKDLYKTDFTTLYKEEKQPRVKIRYLGLSHIQEGKKTKDVAETVKVTQQAIRDWIKRFNKEGINGLKEKPGRGVKQRLPQTKVEEFKDAIENLQRNRKGGRVKVADIKDMLEDKFEVAYKVKGIYTLLERLDMVWITARSQHPESDPEVQEAFKKNLRMKQ